MSDLSNDNRFAPPRAQVAEPATLGNEPVLAGRGARFAAVFLDGIIISFIVWPLFFVFGGSGAIFVNPDPADAANPFALMGKMIFSMIPGYVIAAAIQGWFLHTSGQTLGKKVMGLRIVRADGSRAGFVRLFFARAGVALLPGFIPLIGFLWTLIDSVVIFRSSHQCLHDQIADTIVVTASSSPNTTLAASKSR